MTLNQSEKIEIIRMVEESNLSVRKTLSELDIPRSTIYKWYARYLDYGYDGLADLGRNPKRVWNHIPDAERERVRQIALDKPDLTPRELAFHIIDTQKYYYLVQYVVSTRALVMLNAVKHLDLRWTFQTRSFTSFRMTLIDAPLNICTLRRIY
ncbi:MAG: helix-turn-helix domain containing protein [Calditrichaeota bacterium]|nr:helix-turn-helix domain containing protein [Calditrichota bacterium]